MGMEPLTAEEIEHRIGERADARKRQEIFLAAEIRIWLSDRGVVLEDTLEGTRWTRLNP